MVIFMDSKLSLPTVSHYLLYSIYADVAPTLKTWHEQGFRVCIYSSGSVEAQKLLFQYSVEGDLLPVNYPLAYYMYIIGLFCLLLYLKHDVYAANCKHQNNYYLCFLQYLSGHFDTHIGNKREHSSYLKIAEELSVDPQDVLFLTDIPAGTNIHPLLAHSLSLFSVQKRQQQGRLV